MSDRIVNVSVRLEPDGGDAQAALSPDERRAAMLLQLHQVLQRSWPGLTVEALAKMIDDRIFDQVVERLALRKLLDHPQGNA